MMNKPMNVVVAMMLAGGAWADVVSVPIRTFAGHASDVYSVAFSPDGSQVLTGSGDNTAKLWDAATGTEIRTFSGYASYVSSVAFSPDGSQVLTGSGRHGEVVGRGHGHGNSNVHGAHGPRMFRSVLA